MKEESVLNVLIYLFKNHIKGSCNLNKTSEELFERLEEAGFETDSIYQAFDWLEQLIQDSTYHVQAPAEHSTRVFSAVENELFSTESQRLILTLQQRGILNAELREIIINQLFCLNLETVDLGLTKWVILMVLFNQTNMSNAFHCMELLALDHTTEGVH